MKWGLVVLGILVVAIAFLLVLIAGFKKMTTLNALWESRNLGARLEAECGDRYLENDTKRYTIYEQYSRETAKELAHYFKLFHVAFYMLIFFTFVWAAIAPFSIYEYPNVDEGASVPPPFYKTGLAITGILLFFTTLMSFFKGYNTLELVVLDTNYRASWDAKDDTDKLTVKSAFLKNLQEMRKQLVATVWFALFVCVVLILVYAFIGSKSTSGVTREMSLGYVAFLSVLCFASLGMWTTLKDYSNLVEAIWSPYTDHVFALSKAAHAEITAAGKGTGAAGGTGSCPSVSVRLQQWVNNVKAANPSIKLGNNPKTELTNLVDRENGTTQSENRKYDLFRYVEITGSNVQGGCSSNNDVQKAVLEIQDKEPAMDATIGDMVNGYHAWLLVLVVLITYGVIHGLFAATSPGRTATVFSLGAFGVVAFMLVMAWFQRETLL